MREVVLLRHAKAEPATPSGGDHDRPLAERGRRDVGLLAGYLADSGARPDLVLCSSARRARETVEGVAAGLPADVPVEVADDLYQADVDDLLARLAALPGRVAGVLLCGHDPAMHRLALTLVGRGPDDRLRTLREKLPAGGLVRLRCDADRWADLAPGCGELVAFVTPKELAEPS